jgi:hypothetical protein
MGCSRRGGTCHPQGTQLTIEDYVNSRYILNPLRLWDCDRPVNASGAYLFATAERARDIEAVAGALNHSQHNFRQRTTQPDLDGIEDWTDRNRDPLTSPIIACARI